MSNVKCECGLTYVDRAALESHRPSCSVTKAIAEAYARGLEDAAQKVLGYTFITSSAIARSALQSAVDDIRALKDQPRTISVGEGRHPGCRYLADDYCNKCGWVREQTDE